MVQLLQALDLCAPHISVTWLALKAFLYLLPLIVFLTLQGPAQGFFDLFSKLIALITYYCNVV